MVAKRSGVTEPFSRAKVVDGVRRACQGRPVDEDALAKLAQQVEEAVRGSGQAEVPSQEIGLAILGPLRELDEVAYLRFASVYRSFTSADDFAAEIRDMRGRRTAPDPVDPGATVRDGGAAPPQRRQASTTRPSTSADRPRACRRRSVCADRIRLSHCVGSNRRRTTARHVQRHPAPTLSTLQPRRRWSAAQGKEMQGHDRHRRCDRNVH